MTRIGLLGFNGRMGQSIASVIAMRENCMLAAALVRDPTRATEATKNLLLTDQLPVLIKAVDVVIDFTCATATPEFARKAAQHGKPFMTGTTGMDAEGVKALRDAAKDMPVLYAPNTSLSLVAMKRITTLAAQLLAQFDYDVAILDEHHRHKKDAPSGTAKALGEAVLTGNKGRKVASYSALRAGAIVGEHQVIFAGQGETIRLHHSVTDRRIFAEGAVDAALWLHNKPKGFYGMDDVLGL